MDRIVTFDGDLSVAITGQSITCTLADEIDVSRGDILALASAPCEVADPFETHLLWMAETPMIAGRQYVIKIGATTALCTSNQPKYRTEAARAENIRRIAEVAKLMSEAGLITLVSFISPFATERAMARELIGSDQFVEIFIDAPLDVVELRDSKGLYKKARDGQIQNFTGIGSRYEAPQSPDLRLETAKLTPNEAVTIIMEMLRVRGIIA